MLLPIKLNLPESTKSQSGQVIIVFLLILVVGLAVVLSIASRTVNDVRQSTTSDESNRAYFAAEAGVEKALKQITENPSFTTGGTAQTTDFTAVNKSQTAVTVDNLYTSTDASNGKIFEVPGKVNKDDSVQLYLMSNYADIATAGVSPSLLNTDTINIYWDDPASATSGPALEVSVLGCINGAAACTNTSTYKLSKWAFDPDTSRNSTRGTNFCADPTLVSSGTYAKPTNLSSSVTYKYKAVVHFSTNSPCAMNDTLGSYRPVLVRLRLLYNPNGPVQMAVESDSSNGGRILPNQGQKIVSTGKLDSGVTRKLTVTKLYPSLPSIFDYSLYDGSTSQTLTK